MSKNDIEKELERKTVEILKKIFKEEVLKSVGIIKGLKEVETIAWLEVLSEVRVEIKEHMGKIVLR